MIPYPPGIVLWVDTTYGYRLAATQPRGNPHQLWQAVATRTGLSVTQPHPPIPPEQIPDHHQAITSHLIDYLQHWEIAATRTMAAAARTGQTAVYHSGGPLDGQQHTVRADRDGRPALCRHAAVPPKIEILPANHNNDTTLRFFPDTVTYTRGPYPQPDGRWLYHLEGEQP